MTTLSKLAGLAATCILMIAIFGIVLLFTKYYILSQRPRNFPPGPQPLPIIGNLNLLPKSKGFLKFHELGKEYGPIVGLKFGPQNVVVLNNWKHVKDLFDKRGAIYSSRPESYVGSELICPGEVHGLLMPYGDRWRKTRKVVMALLNVNAVDNFLPLQNAEATQTMVQLLEDPKGYYDHIRRYSTSVILSALYGQRGSQFDSPKVQALYHAQDQFTAILEPGATPPVDAFPFLRYVPEFMASWKVWAQRVRSEQRALYFGLLQETKDAMVEKTCPDCFVKTLLEETRKDYKLEDEQLSYLAGALMEAGSDTTASTILSFVLAMIKYPESLKKAQDEVDRVCGSSRSPTSDDIKSLPFLAACMQETFRWRPVAAGGIPHSLTQDDTYEGYFLPKGTMLFANTWAIHRDEAEYDQPDEFIPERYLSNKFGTRQPAQDGSNDNRRITYAFGAGRRICSGQRMAENSLMINMAKLAWGFDMLPGLGHVEVDVRTAYTDGFLTAPKLFDVTFRPRSDKHREVIMQEFETAKELLAKYE